MFNGSNCDRKSQLSGILTEPLNPRVSGSKGHTVKISTRINSLVLKDTQSNEIATRQFLNQA